MISFIELTINQKSRRFFNQVPAQLKYDASFRRTFDYEWFIWLVFSCDVSEHTHSMISVLSTFHKSFRMQ